MKKEVNVDGKLVYWSSRPVERASVEKAVAAMPEPRMRIPHSRDPLPCLRDALKKLFGGPQTLVRPLGGKQKGYVVISEVRDADGNDYTQQTAYELAVPDILTWNVGATPHNKFSAPTDVVSTWQQYLDSCDADQMTVVFQRYLRERCHGITLREHGGMYWIPEYALDNWKALQTAVSKMNPAGYSNTGLPTFNEIVTVMDGDSAAAFSDSLSNEIDDLERTIMDHITDPTKGKLSLDRRAQEAAVLAKKVSAYSRTLGTSLEKLDKRLETIKQSASKAALVAAARKAGGGNSTTDPARRAMLEKAVEENRPDDSVVVVDEATPTQEIKFPWEE